MEAPPARVRLHRWLAPSPEPGLRRLVVAGLAGILLTAPLSLQRLVGEVRPLGYVLTVTGALLAVWCCRRAWTPSTAVTVVATVVCVAFAAVTIVDGASQFAAALRSTDTQLVCTDDVEPAIVTGAQEILHGNNPYTAYDVLRAERALGCSSFHVTALRAGVFASRSAEPTDAERTAVAAAAAGAGHDSTAILVGFSWPAGSALAGIAGARGVVVLTVLSLIVAVLVVVRAFPPGTRRWPALALAAQAGVLVFTGQTRPDGIVAALLLVSCARRQPASGGAALGLACAIKQTAWFVALPLLVLGFRQGARVGLSQAGAFGAAFAAVNVPFIAAGPSAWWAAVAAPQASPMFPLGAGPVALFTGAGHPAGVVAVFTATMALTVIAGCLLAWRGRDGWAHAGVILAMLGLWDGPRSLLFYFGLFGLVAVGICARLASRPDGALVTAGATPDASARVVAFAGLGPVRRDV